MNKIRRKLTLSVFALLNLLLVTVAVGASPDISINFVGCCNGGATPTPTPLLSTDVAGVVPRGNWNNLSGTVVNDAILNDSNGAPTTVTITYSADEQWGSGAGLSTPDRKMLNGYLGISNDGNYRPLFLNNVPNGAYKLIMYNGRGDAQAQGYTVNPASVNTTLHIMPEGPFTDVWIRGTSTNPGARDVCNYVQFDEVAPIGGTITIDCRSESFRGMMNGIQLIPLDPGAFRFVNQPADATRNEGGSVSFVGGAVDGVGAITYQWLTNGVPDTSNLTPTYNRSNLNANENGRTFALVATDSTSQSVTSRVATLTVNSLTFLVSAASNGRTNRVYASFGAAVALTGTYTLNNGATVFSAAYGATHKDVVLETSILFGNAAYTLTATGETREDNGDPTVPNPNTINFIHGYGSFCTDFASLPPGAALFKNAENLAVLLADDGTGTNMVVHLTDDGNNGAYGKLFITNRMLGANLNLLDARWRVRIGGDLGGHADGMTFSWANNLATDGNFVAVEEGEGNGVSFVIDTWDGGSGPDTGIDIKWQGVRLPGSFLHIPRTSEGNANFICQDALVSASASVNSSGVATFTYNGNTVSAVIPGWAGIANGAYVFSARTGGENDNFWVDDVCINNFTLGPVFFTLEPVETTVLEGLTATFTSAVDGSPSYSYQWFTNGVAITGATSPNYTTPPVTEAFEGRLYSVMASNEFSSVTSSNAVLHVNISPRVVSVSSRGDNKVHILYTRNVDLGPDFGPPYYDFDNGAFEASRAYGADHKEVIITTDASLIVNSTYTLTIQDVAGEGQPSNVLLPNPTVVAFHHGYGSVCTDFAVGLPPGASTLGSATVAGGFLHITDAVNSQQGNAFFPDPNNGFPVDRLLVKFKMQLGGGTCCGDGRWADGMSFNVASDISSVSSYGEEGAGGGLTITFDTWDNAAPDTAPAIEVRYRGAVVAVQSMAGIREDARVLATPLFNDVNGNPLSLDTSNTFANVQLIIAPDGKLDLYFKDYLIFQNVQLPGYTPFEGANFGFGARTGGANENAWIDDLCINGFSLGSPTIVQEPADQTIFEVPPPRFTFGVGVDGLPPYSVQWYSNGVPIAGATGLYYSTPPLLRAASGSGYSAVIANSFGSITSRTAIATIELNDPIPQLAVSFTGRGDCAPTCSTLASSDVAGLMPQGNWNNILNDVVFDGTSGLLNDSNGTPTLVTLTYDAQDAWNNDGPSVTGDEKLFKGISKAAQGHPTNTYTFNQVRPGFLYDVIVYLNVNGDNRIGDISCGNQTYYFTSQHTFAGSFIQVTNKNPLGTRDTGNFVRFYGVGADASNQIRFTFINRGDADGIGIAGVQLLPVPASATLAVSFTGRDNGNDAGYPLAPTTSAGLVPQTNWNNIANGLVFDGTNAPLGDANGAATAVTLTYDANDSWNNDGASGTGDEQMFKGISKAAGVDRVNTYTFSNVRPGIYDLIAYLNVNGDGRNGDISCNGVTYYYTSQHSFAGSFIQALNTNPGGPRDVGNYVRFYGITVSEASSGQIPVTLINRAVADGVGVSGFQLIQVYGPALLAANTIGNPNLVRVTFGAAMNDTALNPANYALNNGVTVSGAVFESPASNVVRLTTTTLTVGTPYTLTVTDAQDQLGLALAPNPSTASFTFGSEFPLGGLRLNRYDGSSDFATLLSKIATCVVPSKSAANMPDFEYTTSEASDVANGNLFGDGNTDNYGMHVYGQFAPPTTGNYQFGFSSDDHGELFLSTDASPANKVLITQIPAWNAYRRYVTQADPGSSLPTLSAMIPLVAGRTYYMEAVVAEGGGGDHVAVAVRLPGDPSIMDFQPSIPGSMFANNYIYNASCPPVLFSTIGNVIVSENPGSTNVIENNVHVFRFGFDGTPPYSVQWFSNNVPVSGSTVGTNSTFTLTVRAVNAGNTFYAVVNNDFSSATSTVATLSVTLAPQMTDASSRNDPANHIYVQYSKEMGASAIDFTKYSVSAGVTVSAAAFHNASNTLVRLDVSPLTAGSGYSVTVQDVLDTIGNLLNPNPTTRSFTHLSAPGVNAPAGLVLKRYNGANNLTLLRNAINNCTAPTFTDTAIGQMSYFPANLDNYGTWMYGQFAPPTTGNYQFQVQGDDNVQLFLSTDELPANKVLIASQTAWGSTRDYVEPNQGGTVTAPSAMIPLVAGRTYYLELLHQEGGGGDHVQATVRLPGGPAIVDNAPDISRNLFATNSSFGCPPQYYFNFGPMVVTQQPVSATVNELSPVTFTAKVDGSPSYAFQWYSNSVPVPGATNVSYSFAPLRFANGAQYQLIVNNGFSSATSDVATLTVISDEVPPVVVNVLSAPSRTVLGIIFNEPLTLLQATNPANYTITNAAGTVLAHSASVLPEVSPDGKSVTLRTDPQASGGQYFLVLNNLTDRAGVPNMIVSPTVVPFTASDLFYAPGVVLFRAYPTGGGNAIAELTNHPSYLNNQPDFESVITAMNSRLAPAPYNNNSRDNYGGAIVGHFIPPTSGNWIFYISSDDDGLLKMNTNGPNSTGASVVRFAPGCCRPLANGSDPTPPISLLAGQAYYIEALLKEGGGGDYVEVGARLVGDNSPITIIGSANLAFASKLTITQDPTNLTVLEGQNASFSVAVTVAGAGGGSQRYQWQRSEDPSGVSFTNIPSATASSYTFRAFDVDNGIQFRVVVALPGLQTNVSAAATLTVNEDLVSPTLLSARVGDSYNQLILTYSEPMDPGTASEASNFFIDENIFGAVREVFGSVIIITLSQPLAPNTPYILYGYGQADEFGNPTDPADTESALFIYQPFGLNHRYSFGNPPGSAGGSNVLDSVGGAHGQVLGAGATFTGDRVTLPGGASATQGYIDLPNRLLSTNGAVNGGSGKVTLEGWVQVTGSRAWSRIVDFGSATTGELTGPGGGGDGQDYLFYSAQENVNTGRRNVVVREVNPLPDGSTLNSEVSGNYDTSTFGTEHYFVITWDEVTGQVLVYENNVQVTSFVTPVPMHKIDDVNVWLGRSQWSGDQNMQGNFNEFRMYDRVITPEERAFNFAVGPNNSFEAPLAVRIVVETNTMSEGSTQQARVFADFTSISNVDLTAGRGFSLISDAPTLVSVSPAAVLTTGSGVSGTANLTATFAGVTSDPVAITVLQDTGKPTVLSVNGTRSLDSIRVVFSEPVNPAQAQEPTNYILTDTNTNPVAFGTPVLGGDGRTVTIPVTGGHLAGAVFVLNISGISDLAGVPNTMVTTNITFQTWIWSRGFAIADYYLGIGGGLISDLTNNPAYPNSPGLTEYVSLLESRANWADNYGTRISARLRAPRTGNYHFFIASDDESAIYLSTDLDPANRVQIATEPQWAGGREFIYPSGDCCGRPGNYRTNNPPYLPVNIASNIALIAGSSYYIEALAKEGGGGDHLAVAWQFPGSPAIVNGSEPIQGTYLSSLADPVGASITVVTQPQSTNILSGMSLTLTATSVGTNVNGSAPVAYQWQRLDNGVWTDIFGANSASYPFTSVPAGLNAQYRARIFIPGAEAVSATATVVGIIAIDWDPLGVLQEANEVTGPWTDIVPTPSNPFIVFPGDAPMKFYRLKP